MPVPVLHVPAGEEGGPGGFPNLIIIIIIKKTKENQ